MRLDRFLWAKAGEVAALRRQEREGRLPAPFAGSRGDFAAALRRPAAGAPLAVIAEYKRASPSRGVICQDLTAAEVARQYAHAGASALSVLSEERFFQGRLDYLAEAHAALAGAGRPLPLLRKDFLFDPLQVVATAATPAAALLLIVGLIPDAHLLRHLRELAESLGMQAVVEVFDAGELAIARDSGARILQVNARNLATLRVDCDTCLDLARRFPPQKGECWIAASGMARADQLRAAAEAGYDAALVGTALMQGGRPGQALHRLLDGGSPAAEEGAPCA